MTIKFVFKSIYSRSKAASSFLYESYKVWYETVAAKSYSDKEVYLLCIQSTDHGDNIIIEENE